MREPSSAVVFPCANKGWSWYSNVQTPGALYALVAFFCGIFLLTTGGEEMVCAVHFQYGRLPFMPDG